MKTKLYMMNEKVNDEPLRLVVPYDVKIMDSSMFYIPNDWIKNKDNESKIHSILNKHLFTNINVDVNPAIKELNDIGETIVIDKIKDGTIVIN